MGTYLGKEINMIDYIRMKKSKRADVGDKILIERGDKIYPRESVRRGMRGYVVKKSGKVAGTDILLEKGDMIVSRDR